MNGKQVDAAELDNHLTSFGELSSQMGITVTCTPGSSHSRLVIVLDLCAKAGLENITLMSR